MIFDFSLVATFFKFSVKFVQLSLDCKTFPVFGPDLQNTKRNAFSEIRNALGHVKMKLWKAPNKKKGKEEKKRISCLFADYYPPGFLYKINSVIQSVYFLG